jgi:anti-anti-sigma regulatory factor
MDTVTLDLPAQLTIRSARATREQLLDGVRGSQKAVILDGSAVTDVDGAGIQLLLATLRELIGQDRPMALRPSPAITSALHHMGLERLFGLAGEATP